MRVSTSESTPPRSARPVVDVAVIGAGVVGSAIAVACLRAGCSVALVDPAPGGGATHAAAGMISPAGEFSPEEAHLAALLALGATRLEAWIERLPGGASACGYETGPTLLVGVDAADRRRLEDLLAPQRAVGYEVRAVGIREARGLEPLLTPGLAAAHVAERDRRVDPRRLAAALVREVSASAGGEVVAARALRLTNAGGRVGGVELDDGRTLVAGEVVVANASGASALGALPGSPAGLVREVRGDVARLHAAGGDTIRHTVRGLARGRAVYLVPRADGTVVVGATQREDRLEGVSTGGVRALLEDACELVPALDEHVFVEAIARSRPTTPDHAPLVGRVGPGLMVATGTYRHGVLLSALIAEVCARAIIGDPPPSGLDPALIDPLRFAAGHRPEDADGRPPSRTPTRSTTGIADSAWIPSLTPGGIP